MFNNFSKNFVTYVVLLVELDTDSSFLIVELEMEAVDGFEDMAVLIYFLKYYESYSTKTSYLMFFFWIGLGIASE